MKDPYSKGLLCRGCGHTPYKGITDKGEICWVCGGSGIRQDDPIVNRLIGLLIGSAVGFIFTVVLGLEWWVG